ncbi:MAG: hypothetical protein ACREDR_16890, partial [Blastocatellia bacterium]
MDIPLYKYAPQLWVVTSYYNPMVYKRRRYNYDIFSRAIRQSGIPMLTVECAFNDEGYNLPESYDVVRVRSQSLLWQKERLINLAATWLPSTCRYVAWLDCDILFTNSNWARDTIELLNRFQLVQLFETCNRLPESNSTSDRGDVCPSFVSVTQREGFVTGKFQLHGHTGYGWAARRELLDRYGLYEYGIAGSGDHYIAHAAYGDFFSPCIRLMMQGRRNMMRH